MRLINWLGAASVLMTTSFYAAAQTATVPIKPDELIAARQAGYDLMSANMTALKAVVDSGGEVKPYTDTAKAISAWAHVVPTLFPDGTQTGHDTKAKAEIWSDHAGFEKAAANLVTQADKLTQLAQANDKAGFAAQFGTTGQACGACHRAYRAR